MTTLRTSQSHQHEAHRRIIGLLIEYLPHQNFCLLILALINQQLALGQRSVKRHGCRQ